MDELYEQLKSFGKVKLNEPLSKHTTFKIGGPADYFLVVESKDNLVNAVKYLQEQGQDYYVIGGGSNLLVNDDGYKGVVIKVVGGEYTIKDDQVVCDAGVGFGRLLQATLASGLSGLEWGAGMPGTIGGAVYGNARAMEVSMSDAVESVEVLRNGELIKLNNSQCEFGYKTSIFKKEGDLIVQVTLKLNEDSDKEGVKSMLESLSRRNTAQPPGFSAGCTFKNVELDNYENELDKRGVELPENYTKWRKIPAGWLIDQCGLKGKKIGGAEVSQKHANFVLNTGGATAEDIENLIQYIKEKVYDKYGVNLEEEVQRI